MISLEFKDPEIGLMPKLELELDREDKIAFLKFNLTL
jgi:hypothetical protein